MNARFKHELHVAVTEIYIYYYEKTKWLQQYINWFDVIFSFSKLYRLRD